MNAEERLKTEKLSFGLLSDYRRELMGIAALMVMFHHLHVGRTLPDGFSRVYDVLYYLRGVDIFMILSGVGLYYSYSASQKIGLFYKKRYVRLLIPFVLICIPYYFYMDKALHADNFLYYFLTDITQISLYLRGEISSWFVPAIAVFYLFFPVLYRLQNRLAKDGALLNREVCTLLICAVLGALCLTVKKLHPGRYNNVEMVLTRTIPFVFGCWLGKWVKERKNFSFTLLIAAVLFLPLYMFAYMPAVKLDSFWAKMCYAAAAFALCILFSWLLNFKKDGKVHSVLRFFGERSLELYLIHYELNQIWTLIFPEPVFDRYGFTDYLVILILSVILSVPFHYIIGRISKWILKNPNCKGSDRIA